jgi:hypothetical protein
MVVWPTFDRIRVWPLPLLRAPAETQNWSHDVHLYGFKSNHDVPLVSSLTLFRRLHSAQQHKFSLLQT